MDTLYHQTNKLIQQTQQSFQALEQNSGNVQEIEADIQEKINAITSNCEKLDVYLYKVPFDQRPNAKMRCDQLKYDARHLQAALVASRQKRARREAAISEREQLLNRRFAPNPDLTTINIDYALQHQNSLQNSNRGVDEMLHTGVNALESLRSQRLTLKGAHRRIMDMANTLGLSNHTMRLIEKRAGEDKYILMLGIVITVLVIIFIIVYFT
ncbi:probable Golgi SNAP receptor complex member 2 [Tribolium madens]|uniref:probable Golgi SNAP receptor complex member 2 n=1 Tax=Tribolium madens TaxID=41895 RepID=UPI001CF7456E|nr:probable Golgi SNAP receptor complex member 2 [Tribolium madens]